MYKGDQPAIIFINRPRSGYENGFTSSASCSMIEYFALTCD